MFLLLACADAPAAPDSARPFRLTLAGSSTVQPIAEIAASAFEARHPGARVDVQGGGSSVGIASARTGLADIGTVSRALKPEEADLHATTIAYDGIAIVVHASNPVTNLTHAQVVSLFSGETANWAALGGPDRPVTLVSKEAGRSTLELFEHHFDLKERIHAGAVIIGPNGQAISTVAGNPDAVAYVSIGSASFAEQSGTPIRRLKLDGIDATPANVSNGTYPLMRPLNFVTRGVPSGSAKQFVAFVLSPEGQALAAREEFVPVGDAAPAL